MVCTRNAGRLVTQIPFRPGVIQDPRQFPAFQSTHLKQPRHQTPVQIHVRGNNFFRPSEAGLHLPFDHLPELPVNGHEADEVCVPG